MKVVFRLLIIYISYTAILFSLESGIKLLRKDHRITINSTGQSDGDNTDMQNFNGIDEIDTALLK